VTNYSDVWYKFIAPANGQKIVIRTTATDGDNKWVIALYDGCNRRAIDCKLGNDTSFNQTIMELCPYQYTANTTYYVRVFRAVSDITRFIKRTFVYFPIGFHEGDPSVCDRFFLSFSR
jgi:hypothetical protein